MKTAGKTLLVLAAAFLCAGAVPVPDGEGEQNPERRRGFCIIPIPWSLPTFGANKATGFEHQDAVDWVVRPVIDDGYLVAEGNIKGDRQLANEPPGGLATFAVKRRNTDISIAVIVPPLRSPNARYPAGSGHIVATEWQVTDSSFRIKVPASRITVASDLLVWGSDAGQFLSSPLAIHSIEVVD